MACMSFSSMGMSGSFHLRCAFVRLEALLTASSVLWKGSKAKKGAFLEDRVSFICCGCSVHTSQFCLLFTDLLRLLMKEVLEKQRLTWWQEGGMRTFFFLLEVKCLSPAVSLQPLLVF